MTKWQEINKWLKEGQEVILLVHEKPDGDCIGSALGFGLFLKTKGFKPVLYLPVPLPVLYTFLPGQELIRVCSPGTLREETPVIAIDCADTKRLGYTVPASSPLINIDHHISNAMFGVVNIVDTHAAAAGEVIYRIIEEEDGPLPPDIATCLYVAIVTDTGSFRYSNVTSETFRIAGNLVLAGADLESVRNRLFESRPLMELLLLNKALETLSITAEGKIMSAQLPYEVLHKENWHDPDTDGLIGIMRATEGVEVALLFKELEPQLVKVSLRSKSYVDANKLARQFEGGGHPRAAGCTVYGPLDQVIRQVMAEAEKAVNEENNR